MDKVALNAGACDTSQVDASKGFAIDGNTGMNAVGSDGHCVDIAQVDALEPEVGDFGVRYRDVLAKVVVLGPNAIVTTVDNAIVDGDKVVFATQEHNIGVGRGSGSPLGAQHRMTEGDIGRAGYRNNIGIDVVSATATIVGVEVEAVESDIVGSVDVNNIVGGTGGRISYLGQIGSPLNGLESNGVGIVDARHATQRKLLIESLLAEAEDNSTADTGIVEGVEGSGDIGEIRVAARTDNVLTGTKTHIDGAGDGVVGADSVVADTHHGGDCVTAGGEVFAQKFHAGRIA